MQHTYSISMLIITDNDWHAVAFSRTGNFQRMPGSKLCNFRLNDFDHLYKNRNRSVPYVLEKIVHPCILRKVIILIRSSQTLIYGCVYRCLGAGTVIAVIGLKKYIRHPSCQISQTVWLYLLSKPWKHFHICSRESWSVILLQWRDGWNVYAYHCRRIYFSYGCIANQVLMQVINNVRNV